MLPVSGSTITPSGVPKAIVNTGTPAAWAYAAPSSVEAPNVVSPSDSRTIAPGATCSSSLVASPVGAPCNWTSRSVLAIKASPMAVASSSVQPGDRIVDGGAVRASAATSTATEPLNDTTPISTSSATWSTKSVAACCAAASRLGATSVASIDSDVSRARTIRPSLTTRSVVVEIGLATATTPAERPSNCSPATT